VIETLVYADIFKYPLTLNEVFLNLTSNGVNELEVENNLNDLVKKGLVFKHEKFYSLTECASISNLRKERNDRAKKYMKIARRMSGFISSFPFVRGVFLSGSLSKDCMDKDGDIDYFIITEPGRLWLCRTILILFKKIFLFNSYKYFCLNYFVDSKHLEIHHKNLFVATEVLTLIPTYNHEMYQQFINENSWAKAFRPNLKQELKFDPIPPKRSFVKGLFEIILNGKLGDRLERYFHGVTENHWQKKFSSYSESDYHLSIQTKKHTSQINPENFQKKVILEFEERLRNFEKTSRVNLN